MYLLASQELQVSADWLGRYRAAAATWCWAGWNIRLNALFFDQPYDPYPGEEGPVGWLQFHGETMSDVEKLGFLYSLQRLFGFGGDKPKPSQAATEPKKNRPSHAPKHTTSGQGSAKQVPSSEKPAKKAPPLGAKKVTAKPKHGTKFQGPPPAAPAEAPGEVPRHERPAADRQQKSSEEKAAPSIYNPPEQPD